MDKISLTFYVSLNKTVKSKGAKTVIVKTCGPEKIRYTVVLVCGDDDLRLNLSRLLK